MTIDITGITDFFSFDDRNFFIATTACYHAEKYLFFFLFSTGREIDRGESTSRVNVGEFMDLACIQVVCVCMRALKISNKTDNVVWINEIHAA